MILQALTQYYEKQLELGNIPAPGWGNSKVSCMLELAENGAIVGIHSLLTEQTRGKKSEQTRGTKTVWLPQVISVPMPVKRTAGIAANFLCDHSGYLLGVDDKGKPERTRDCFKACRTLHLKVLEGLQSPAAKAVRAFFAGWQPAQADEHPLLKKHWGDACTGGNLVFWFDGAPVLDDPEIRAAWEKHYAGSREGDTMQCLVTGEQARIPNIHPSIKGVKNAQSSGAALVSFNAPAFCSYDREQNLNAPIGEYAAFAYTTALNHLLADWEHVQVAGDTTMVCWAQSGETAYQEVAKDSMMGGSPEEQEEGKGQLVYEALEAIANGDRFEWDNTWLEPDMNFYILGLAPNASRLSVRFFLVNTFEKFMSNLNEHYKRLKIDRPSYDRWEYLPVWMLLSETVNPNSRDKNASQQLTSDLLRAIWSDQRYPATLLNGVMLRIRADHTVTRGRAAIIKAYYSKNKNPNFPEEVLDVSLVTNSRNVPYTLGRMFSVLEAIQEAANPGLKPADPDKKAARTSLNTTIRDQYFNGASATPAFVFPVLVNLAQKHLRKLNSKNYGMRIHFEKQMTELMYILDSETYPARLTLPEQGAFQLGYYHQTYKRYEKKEEK